MSKKIKIFAISILVLCAVVFIGSQMGGSDVKPPGTLESSVTNSPPAGSISSSEIGTDEFALLLSTIRTISIDTSILNSTEYKTLRDYPVTLGTDIVGRNNPFAPIGSDSGEPVRRTTDTPTTNNTSTTIDTTSGASTSQSAPSTITGGIQVQTLQPGKITKASAEMGAQVTGDASATSVVFEYGLTDTFGSMTAPVMVNQSGTALSTVTNLLSKTTYKVRAILIKGTVPINGNIVSFTTL